MWAQFFMERFGPLITARELLGPRFEEWRQHIMDIWRHANQARGGSLQVPQEYLLSIIRL
jgi:hypothetical protein